MTSALGRTELPEALSLCLELDPGPWSVLRAAGARRISEASVALNTCPFPPLAPLCCGVSPQGSSGSRFVWPWCSCSLPLLQPFF